MLTKDAKYWIRRGMLGRAQDLWPRSFSIVCKFSISVAAPVTFSTSAGYLGHRWGSGFDTDEEPFFSGGTN